MTDTEFPTARVIWKARAIGQDINDPGGIPEEIPLGGIKVDLIPNPKVIECTNGAGDPVTYRIKEWHLVTANNGELVNYEDPTNGIEIVASDAFPGHVVSWKSIIEDPSGTLPPITKKWLAPAGSIVDLTTVISVPNNPNPIADYLQAVYDAREARDNAIAARIAAETALAAVPGAVTEQVNSQVAPEVTAATNAKNEAIAARIAAETARTGAETALNAVPGVITEQVTTQVAPEVAAATTAKNDAVAAKTAAEKARDETEQVYVLLGNVSGTKTLTLAETNKPTGWDATLTANTDFVLPSLGNRILTCSLYLVAGTAGVTYRILGAKASYGLRLVHTGTLNAVDLVHLLHFGPRGWIVLSGAAALSVPAGWVS